MSGKSGPRFTRSRRRTAVEAYSLSVLCVAVAFFVRLACDPLWGDRLPFGTFFMAELVVAQFAGVGPFVFTMVTGFVLADWFFIQPRHSLAIDDLVNRINALVFVVLSLGLLFISWRAHRALARERAAQDELVKALSEIKVLQGLLPICSGCKKIRDDKGSWNQLEIFIRDHSGADFTHSICPDCAKALYPEFCTEDVKPPAPGPG